ncbi:unnamed protein product [Schistosoma rodhaini]|uniref:BUB1 N-terminal domain-containing protein n=1 Tax=Schistosoma rodhaini TaxID=6188 RepID=A0AA85FEP1_9TREM|nr:unnamed protein product [Schistosoma rodhaini]
MSEANNFEWELSKENIKPLKSGRSVELLNKVLTSQRSNEFQLRRRLLREYFELKLASLSTSNKKFQLYSRYIKWIEQNYPSLGKSADLQNVLYRSIRDSSDLPGIKNNDIYVGNWIKLTEYCNQPIELFELLFRQGIGTMCSEFYITWCQLLEKGKNYRKIASIYAHGLRAGAKPLLWLEDRAEAFFHRYQSSLKSAVTSSSPDIVDTFVSDNPSNENPNENTRKKLASLRLIETGTQENKLVAPVMRTKEMWRSNQSGLGTIHPSETIISNKCNYQIKQDKLTQENSVFIRDLPPIASDFIRPVGIPSSWQKENQLEPNSWNKVQLTTTTTVPASSRPISLPNWEIFTEDQVEQKQTNSSNLLNNTQQLTVCTKRKGLKMKSLKESDPCQPTNEISFIEVSSFNHLLHHHDHDVFVVDHSSSHQSDVLLTKLNLPSFPSDKISEIDCFAFDISLIYGGIEELCWEMHRGVKWDINYTNSIKDDHRRILNDFWDKEELELMEEIDTILHDHNNDDGTVNNLQMNDPLLISKNVESTRYALIKSLESIALN